MVTNVLTGVGPWTVVWSLNQQTFVQGPVGVGPGPFTNTLVVYPTNTIGATTISNNLFFVTGVTDTASCLQLPKDITGTNTIAVQPLASIAANGFTLRTNDFFLLKDLGGNPATTTSAKITSRTVDNSGNIFLGMSFATGSGSGQSLSNFLYITNHLVLSGAPPWTVTMMEVGR